MAKQQTLGERHKNQLAVRLKLNGEVAFQCSEHDRRSAAPEETLHPAEEATSGNCRGLRCCLRRAPRRLGWFNSGDLLGIGLSDGLHGLVLPLDPGIFELRAPAPPVHAALDWPRDLDFLLVDFENARRG
eukprot:CAMPEP_0183529198 /NCGR_PEP_ID=MMETSP0371-20130417/23246_1 /TAXON_ID=268820 /ORGANISM="Peridinium aciculiferum, Strain PAER-2" /LENGTH=129 /DNA_ID=CAMNT_0025728913 /DNA_START=296 /DNA_END=685 /DNA_ORIENTATION=-